MNAGNEQQREGWQEGLHAEEPPETPSDRAFGLTFAGLFTLLGAWSLWSGRLSGLWWVALGVGVLILALAAPACLAPANRVWTLIGRLLRKVVTPVVMAVMFFCVIAPLGFLLRALGRDPLERRIDKNRASYWIARERGGSMRNQF